MISSLPRRGLVLFGRDLRPLLRHPVQDINGVKSLLIWSTTPKNNDPIILRVITHRTIGSLGGCLACGFDFRPFHGGGVEGPHIIHINRFCITSEVDDLISDDAATMAPSGKGYVTRLQVQLGFVPGVLLHNFFLSLEYVLVSIYRNNFNNFLIFFYFFYLA